MKSRSLDWYRQAVSDLIWARESVAGGHFAQGCFVSQQVAEKGLKALALHRGADEARGHSVTELVRALQINDEVEKAARRLDQYYISTRYPDAFPSGAPFEYFTEEQAKEAIKFAELIMQRVNEEASFE